MLPRDGLETEPQQPIAEPLRHGPQVREQGHPLTAADQLERGQGGCRFSGRDRVGVDVEGVPLAQPPDHRSFAGDVAAIDAHRLPQGADQHVGAPAGDLLGAAPGGAESTDAVRVVHHQHAAAREARIVLPAQLGDAIDRRVVAAHAEHAIRDHQRALRLSQRLLEPLLQGAQVEVPVHLPCLVRGELHAVDDAVVVQLVGDEHRLGRSQAEEHARDRRVSGAGQHACRAAMKVGQCLLEPDVRRVRAADEPHRSRTHPVPAGGVLLRLDQLAPQREPEIRVRVHPDELALAESLEDEAGAPAALRRLHAQHHVLLAFRDARSVEVGELCFQVLEQLLQRHGVLNEASAACRRRSRPGRSGAPSATLRARRCRRSTRARNRRWPAAADRPRTRCGTREYAS